MGLQLSQNPEADALLDSEPLALLVGMLLDQQVPMEWAFTGPYTIAQRMGGGLDAHEIAACDPEEFVRLCSEKPAIHRYPGSMARRVQQLCRHVADGYDGEVQAIWRDARDGRDLLRRLQALPGYGQQKAQIFVALLGKQLGVRPNCWREAAGSYGEEGAHRSIADVVDDASLDRVRAYKQEMKRARRRS
ncbi:MAG: HhH-GPD-type base excision DNA repair protein [Streptosporangiaceae bacterium]